MGQRGGRGGQEARLLLGIDLLRALTTADVSCTAGQPADARKASNNQTQTEAEKNTQHGLGTKAGLSYLEVDLNQQVANLH
eukprot:647647-Prorocentrum_minimum.AAC.1